MQVNNWYGRYILVQSCVCVFFTMYDCLLMFSVCLFIIYTIDLCVDICALHVFLWLTCKVLWVSKAVYKFLIVNIIWHFVIAVVTSAAFVAETLAADICERGSGNYGMSLLCEVEEADSMTSKISGIPCERPHPTSLPPPPPPTNEKRRERERNNCHLKVVLSLMHGIVNEKYGVKQGQTQNQITNI